MASVQFSDYCFGFINSAITAAQTTFAVTLNVASRPLPTATGGNYFYLTLMDAVSFQNGVVPPASWEVIKVTANAAGTLTVTRNISSSSGAGIAFALGDRFELRIPSQALVDISATVAPTYTAPFAGSVTRTGQSKWSDIVAIDDYGPNADYNPATGTGTDDTPAFLRAAAALGATGGTIKLNPTKSYYIGTILTLPTKISIEGSFQPGNAGGAPGSVAESRYDTCGSVLAINASAYIALSGNSGLRSLIMYRAGIVWPVVTAAAYAGSCVVGNGDDVAVTNCMMLGFAQAFQATGFGRMRIHNCGIDCTAGIFIQNAGDIPYISDVHCWPFLNVNSFGVTSDLWRTGAAFKFSGLCDQMKLSRCFAYAYLFGFQFINTIEVYVECCSVDGGNTSSTGYEISGTASAHLIGCASFSQLVAVHCNTSAFTNITGGSLSQSGIAVSQAIKIEGSGPVNVVGTVFDLINYTINIASTTAVVSIDACRFSTALTAEFVFNAVNANLFIGANNSFQTAPVFIGPFIPQTLASAATITPPPNGTFVSVSGSTGITTINGARPNRMLTLLFNAALTVTNGGVGANLHLNGNMPAVNGSQLTLMGIGLGLWVEISRLV